MHTNQPYTLALATSKDKLLHLGSDRRARTVTTLHATSNAEMVARTLNWFVGDAWIDDVGYPAPNLLGDARRAGTEPANLRRRTLTAYDQPAQTAASLWKAETAAADLRRAVADAPVPVVRAVRDELARLLEPYDGVLVTATVEGFDIWSTKHLIVNDWLTSDPTAAEELATQRDELAAGEELYSVAAVDHYADLLGGMTSDRDGEAVATFDLDRYDAWRASR